MSSKQKLEHIAFILNNNMNMAYDITLNSGVKVTVTPADIAELVELAMRDPIGRVLAVKKFHTKITLVSKKPLADSKCFIDDLLSYYKTSEVTILDIDRKSV